MGHELTHGFDDEGRQFDADGQPPRLVDARGGRGVRPRARRASSKQFDGYVAVDDVHVNGKLTLGENIADLGGLKLALRRVRSGAERERPAHAEARRVHDGAAVLPRLRAGVVHQDPPGDGADARRRPIRTRRRSSASTGRCRTCRSSPPRSSARRATRWCARRSGAARCGDGGAPLERIRQPIDHVGDGARRGGHARIPVAARACPGHPEICPGQVGAAGGPPPRAGNVS